MLFVDTCGREIDARVNNKWEAPNSQPRYMDKNFVSVAEQTRLLSLSLFLDWRLGWRRFLAVADAGLYVVTY